MKGKKTPFEHSTGNCHAEIAPPVIFLDVLSSCEHAVIPQNPLSSTQMSSAHQLPRYLLTKQVTVLQSCYKKPLQLWFSLGPPGSQLMPAERDQRKPCCWSFKAQAALLCMLRCWSIQASSGARTCSYISGEATAGHHQPHTTLLHTATHIQKQKFIC